MPFDDALRRLILQVIQATHELLAARRTPLAEYQAKRCAPCSLIDLCQPTLLKRSISVEGWLRLQLKEG
ncbi:PD-(D/E)XK nuclease family protein [Pseudomonas mangiferae]|uniref:hypothetical protein n=1 Tax=Pseudomonas mangiferae TaxID=2593654 RepID=UPI0022796459|nr:hypothetical protein [Pseudomonas mangiferae]